MVRAGTDNVNPTIFLIDFGLAQQFCSPATYLHTLFTTKHSVVGTLPFTSVNGQKGFAQSHRDDLESLAYTIIFLARGNLLYLGALVPFAGITRQSSRRRCQSRQKSCVKTCLLPSPNLSSISVPFASTRSQTTNTFRPSSCIARKPRLTSSAKCHPLLPQLSMQTTHPVLVSRAIVCECSQHVTYFLIIFTNELSSACPRHTNTRMSQYLLRSCTHARTP